MNPMKFLSLLTFTLFAFSHPIFSAPSGNLPAGIRVCRDLQTPEKLGDKVELRWINENPEFRYVGDEGAYPLQIYDQSKLVYKFHSYITSAAHRDWTEFKTELPYIATSSQTNYFMVM